MGRLDGQKGGAREVRAVDGRREARAAEGARLSSGAGGFGGRGAAQKRRQVPEPFSWLLLTPLRKNDSFFFGGGVSGKPLDVPKS